MTGSAVQRDRLVESLLDVIDDLQRRVKALEGSHPGRPGVGVGQLAFFNEQGMIDAGQVGVIVPLSTANVANPPTTAQCEDEFGAASLGDGVRGVIDDNGAGSVLWLICVVNGVWGAEQLTVL